MLYRGNNHENLLLFVLSDDQETFNFVLYIIKNPSEQSK